MITSQRASPQFNGSSGPIPEVPPMDVRMNSPSADSPLFASLAASPPMQQQQEQQQNLQQHQQQQNLALSSTPWTLGSTDGSYAMRLALYQQQQQQAASQGVAITPDTGEGGAGDGSSPGNNPAADNGMSSALSSLASQQSLYQDRLFRQPSAAVESNLAASCEIMGFDIAEMWLRTGAKTHQLTNSHLRPTALEDSERKDLVDVYYGGKSSERTHRLSPALCKRAKEANDVVWITAHTPHGEEALRCSISNVRTAVAIPVCHEASNTNLTIIFFSMRR
jgi:hypothetical protein